MLLAGATIASDGPALLEGQPAARPTTLDARFLVGCEGSPYLYSCGESSVIVQRAASDSFDPQDLDRRRTFVAALARCYFNPI